MTTSPILEARAVSKRVRDGRGRREVLSNISLAVPPGALVLLLGPSGSGKTTLLAILGGMLLPTSGEVHLDGEIVSRLRDEHRAEVRRRKVGYVFQDVALVSGLTARANVLLPLVPDGLDHGPGQARALEVLTSLGVGDRAGDVVDGLSGGERQRVALARALVRHPKVLLLDEPTAHLDRPRAEALLDDLATIAATGTAIVLTSHDPRVIGDPRVTARYTLDEGRLP